MFENISNKSIKVKFLAKDFMLKNRLEKLEYSSLHEFSNKNFLIPNQTHSTNVTYSNIPGQIDNCDGVFTSNPKIVCCIKVADCMPIFFAHHSLIFYGVVHAGWKGLIEGILKETSVLIEGRGYKLNDFDILIGPSIQKCCFEISNDVVSRFPSENIKPKPSGKFMIDLQDIAFQELKNNGFNKNKIRISNDCSYCQKDKYFSFRRNGKNAGRMIGLISFRP